MEQGRHAAQQEGHALGQWGVMLWRKGVMLRRKGVMLWGKGAFNVLVISGDPSWLGASPAGVTMLCVAGGSSWARQGFALALSQAISLHDPPGAVGPNQLLGTRDK